MSHGAHLEPHIRELTEAIDALGMHRDNIDGLIKRIHQPGFTTPAELEFILGLVQSATGHLQHTDRALGFLMSGAEKVELNPQPLPPGAN